MGKTFIINNGYGDEEVSVQVVHYAREYGGGIAISLTCEGSNCMGEPFGVITTNLGDKLPPFHAVVDTNNMPGAERFIQENGLGQPTGQRCRSGYCEYPVYLFDEDKLMAIDPDGVADYQGFLGKVAADEKDLAARKEAARERKASRGSGKESDNDMGASFT